MLLTITTTYQPATDLGFLLHKHFAPCQTFPLSFGTAHIFYPEASTNKCTAAFLLDIDPIKLVRRRASKISQYVNDRPYVASSFLSVAKAQFLGKALNDRCKELPELAQTPMPLTAKISVLRCRGGEVFLKQLLEPLGYSITVQDHILDEKFPDWGKSPYYTVHLENNITLSQLLRHLYVLIPVLDDDKHYFVGEDEINKLLRHGEAWLS